MDAAGFARCFGAGAEAELAATVEEAADEGWMFAGWLSGFEAGSSGQYPPLACAGAQAKPFLSRYDVGAEAAPLAAVVVVLLPLLAHAVIPMAAAPIPASMQMVDFFNSIPLPK